MEKVENKNPVKGNNVPAQTNEHAAAKTDEAKAKKAASAKAWAEAKKKEAADRKAAAAELLKFLADKKVTIPENCSKMLNELANPASRAGGGGQTVFNSIFGDTPKVGDSITLIDIMKKTLKGRSDLNFYIKQWAKNGVVVEVKEAANPHETQYIIKQLSESK